MNSWIVLPDIHRYVFLDDSSSQVHWPHTNWKNYFLNIQCHLQRLLWRAELFQPAARSCFYQFFKKSNNAKAGDVCNIPTPSHSFGGNQWKTTTYSSMRLRPLKTKELGSVNSNNKNVSFFSLFLSSPHDRLSAYGVSGGRLLAFVEPRAGPSGAGALVLPDRLNPIFLSCLLP